jgi:glycosyltransferase involved in cell wall biosynthesis
MNTVSKIQLPKAVNINKRSRDVHFFTRANRAKVQSVDPKLFNISWNIDMPVGTRILGQPADFGGCGSYRIIYPLLNLIRQQGLQGLISNKKYNSYEIARLKPDTVIFQRQIYDHSIQYVKQVTNINQCFTIMEIDDLLDCIQEKNMSRLDFTDKHVQNLYSILRVVDRLVCSTDFIANEYRKYANEVIVAPNTLERSKWCNLAPQRATTKKPRVGWTGGFSHVGDLEVLIDVVKELHNEVDFIFHGYMHPDIEPYAREFHPAVDLPSYPAKLASLNLDIALAPLECNKFNLGKSHLKVLEYGILGYPVISTEIDTYKGFPVTYIKNNDPKLWVAAIREHINDMDETRKRGDILKKHISDNWMLEDHLADWLNAWTPS